MVLNAHRVRLLQALALYLNFNLVAPKIFEYNVLAKLKDSINA